MRRPFYTGQDFLLAAAQQRSELETAAAETERLRAVHAARRAEVNQNLRIALEELVSALLPDMSPQSLARAAHLTGYVHLTHPDVLGAIDNERQWLTERIAAIEADPRFANRELLRAPRVGTLTRAIEELLHYRAPLAVVLDQAVHPRLERLLQSGYGTDAYDTPFWRTSYYADWQAGDEILERFPDKASFADVRAEVLQAREAITVYDARLDELGAEWAAGQNLEAEYEKHRVSLASIVPRHLARARELLARHIQSSDLGALGARLATDPAVDLLAKRWSGLAHKLLYIDRITAAELDPMEHGIQASLQKLDHDIVKWRRPKKLYAQIPGDVFERRFQSRQSKYQRDWERYTRTYDAVYGFDRYDAARLASDFLWWDLMTDGRIDGDFIPEVDMFHRRYPDYRHPRDHDDDMSAAAAAAAASDWNSQSDRERFFDAS